jgi:rhomboid protease GluP
VSGDDVQHGANRASGAGRAGTPDPGTPDPRSPNDRPAGASGLIEFRLALFAQTPRVWVTQLLVGINVAVFIAMIATGVGAFNPSVDNLMKWGANYGPFTTGGQWWRLLTSMFIHIGVLHIAMNMIGLWQIGFLVERLLGNRGFLVAYVLSGLCGSLASIVWNPFVVSAGASGAVFGVYGVLIAYLLRHRGSIPREVLQPLRRSALLFVGLNVFYGFQVKGIDMAAHLGGLMGGFVVALIVARPVAPEGSRRSSRPSTGRSLLLAVAGIAVVAGMAALVPRLPDLQAELQAAQAMEHDAITTFNGALERNRANQLSDIQLARTIDEQVLTPWRVQEQRLRKLEHLPREPARRVGRLLRYMELREQGWSKLSQALRSNDAALAEEAQGLQRQAEKLLKEMDGAKD